MHTYLAYNTQGLCICDVYKTKPQKIKYTFKPPISVLQHKPFCAFV